MTLRTPPESPNHRQHAHSENTDIATATTSGGISDLETAQATSVLQQYYDDDVDYMMTPTATNQTTNTKKRGKPDHGFSPPIEPQREQPPYIDMNRGSSRPCTTDNHNTHQQTKETHQTYVQHRGLSTTNPYVQRTEPATQPQYQINVPRENKIKWSFIVKSEKQINLSRLLEAISINMPGDSFIIRHNLAKSKKLAVFKTIDRNRKTNAGLNHFLKPTIIDKVRQKYNDQSLEIKHYDASNPNNVNNARNSENETHAIGRGIPLDYSNEWIEEMTRRSNPDIDLTSCHRIRSRERGELTQMIRFIFGSKITAQSVINDGLTIASILVNCEKPLPKPDIQQCYNCQQFNHTTKECENEQCCAKCGGKDHRTKLCPKTKVEYRCPLCKDQHAAWSDNCRAKVEAIRDMKRKEEERKKLLPSAQPATRKEVFQIQKSQTKNQEVVSQKLEVVRETCNEEINKLREELDKKLEDSEKRIKTSMKEAIEEQTKTLMNLLQRSGKISPAQSTGTENQKMIKEHLKKNKEELTIELGKVLERTGENLKNDVKNQTEQQLKKVNSVVDDTANKIHYMVEHNLSNIQSELKSHTDKLEVLHDEVTKLNKTSTENQTNISTTIDKAMRDTVEKMNIPQKRSVSRGRPKTKAMSATPENNNIQQLHQYPIQTGVMFAQGPPTYTQQPQLQHLTMTMDERTFINDNHATILSQINQPQ